MTVVDLFYGVGGLTKGLSNAGLRVVAGIDVDADCEYQFTANNDASFFVQDVAAVDGTFIKTLYSRPSVTVLAGCAPCQPFSHYGRAAKNRRSKWSLLADFARIVSEVRLDIVTTENVPEVALHPVFANFVGTLGRVR
jgi:DNA (cytosine-5)-methyltransferase 1